MNKIELEFITIFGITMPFLKERPKVKVWNKSYGK